MKISIITLFPEMFFGPFDHSIIKRAREKGLIEIEYINIRDFGEGKHKIVDDTDYGGGIGMVMKVDVAHKAISHAIEKNKLLKKRKIVLTSASGTVFSQKKAHSLSTFDHLIIICGHYEGIDERINAFVDEEISIGDFVLTGGEIPALVIIDAVARLHKGVLKEEAIENESFSSFLTMGKQNRVLDYPHYTKPLVYKNLSVPQVLLTGNHKAIDEWRGEKAKEKTQKVRPDLLKKVKRA